jgi:hypothetical protein
MDNKKDIKYLNKDFTDFKSALIEYARAYFPTAYNDFSSASPGTMFIEMAAYVGDVLSFYLDNQLQETFLEYAKQKENLYSLAYMLGYKPKVTSAATVDVDVYQIIPSTGPSTNKTPDYNYALVINENMQINSSIIKNASFLIPDKINFASSNVSDLTDVSIYSFDGIGDPLFYLLKKTKKAISGEVKTATFSYGSADKFITSIIQDTNIIEIIDVYDSEGNRWYEVPFLAQDTILDDTLNINYNDPNYSSDASNVPYLLKLKKVPRRFATRVKSDNTLELQFGSGINQNAEESIIPDNSTVGLGLLDSLSKINTAFDPTNFTTTGTGGFTASANIARIFTFGTTGGSATNSPNLTFTGSGTSAQTLNTGSWFNTLNFGTTAFTLPATALNLNSLTLSSGGSVAGLTPTMRNTGTITSNGNTTLASVIVKV